MPTVSFSLTERVIIDRVLTLRAPLPQLRRGRVRSEKEIVWQGIESSVIARIVALFTSVFAAADALLHLGAALYKGLLSDRAESYAHFRQVASFAKLTLIGSIGGVLSPESLKRSHYTPPSPSQNLSGAPRSIQKLAGATSLPSVEELKKIWSRYSLEEKHWFVQLFKGDFPEFSAVREGLADTVYRGVEKGFSDEVEWQNPSKIDHTMSIISAPITNWSFSFFYHATSKESLQSILKSGKVEVRHEKLFRGAFVSTEPESAFGRCILAFKKNIERLSPLNHGFHVERGAYWAGFDHAIPANEETVAYIILDQGTKEECEALAELCSEWSGWEIPVFSSQSLRPKLSGQLSVGLGIPKEWPEEEEAVGQRILEVLRPCSAVAVQQPIQKRTALVY